MERYEETTVETTWVARERLDEFLRWLGQSNRSGRVLPVERSGFVEVEVREILPNG